MPTTLPGCQCEMLADDPNGLACYTCGRLCYTAPGLPVFNLATNKVEHTTPAPPREILGKGLSPEALHRIRAYAAHAATQGKLFC